jgi:hypothetical protein
MGKKPCHVRNVRGTDTSVGASRQDCRSIFSVMLMLHGHFGAKAALQIALRAEADQRSAERWLAGKSMTAENFAALLRSDVGDQVLSAVMGDPAQWPAWYVAHQRQAKLSTMRRLLTEQRHQLENLEQASLS